MKKLNSIWIVLLATTVLWSCKDNSTSPDSTEVEVPSSQKQFVWNAMNFWYYWQGDVPNLADDRFSDNQKFYEFLNNYSDAESVFETLLYGQEDDFSFFIENYETFEQSRQGISESFGYEYGLVRLSNSNDIFGYVQYVLPDSPAEQAGLERGDLFLSVDGTQLTVNNYLDLLVNKTSYQLSLASISNNTISQTGETISLEAITLQEDPVFMSTVIDTGSSRVGYLMYNSFQTNSHERLNDVFGTFLSEGIDELVLDLRYNGGGSGLTSQTLAGMISGLDDTNVFARYTYSAKRSDLDQSVNFTDEVSVEGSESSIPMNQLSLERVFILTGFGTASASEVVINGLEPYMDVILIGEQTVGKDDGSYTLYDTDAPYLDQASANPNHKIAIQPIILKVVNVDGRDYPTGFEPDYPINEVNFLENLPPLGDASDPLLGQALELISSEPVSSEARIQSTEFFDGEILTDSRKINRYKKLTGGYNIQPERLPNLEF